MGIRDGLGKVLLKDELEAMAVQSEALRQMSLMFQTALDQTPWVFSDAQYLNSLQEIDQDAYDHLRGMEQWESMTGSYGSSDRDTAIRRSVWAFNHLTMYERMVRMWTDQCLGRQFSVVVDPEGGDEGQQIWDDFINAQSNRYIMDPTRFYRQSNRQLVKGELFLLLFASTVDGTVIIRSIKPEQIARIIYDQDDADVPILYQRRWYEGTVAKDRWYKDYRATDKMVAEAYKRLGIPETFDDNKATVISVMHVYFMGIEGRGWPVMHKGVAWGRLYETFLQDRAALQRALLQGWEKIGVKGGSRAVSAMISQLQSTLVNSSSETNPPAPGPSPFIHNQAVSKQREPLTSGASDAATDSMLLLSYCGLAGGIPPGWLGRPDMLQNRATAETLLQPVMQQWKRYSLMWKHTIEELVREVLRAATTYPTENPAKLGYDVNDVTIEVALDIPEAVAFDTIISAVDAIKGTGLLPDEVLTGILLRQEELGISKPAEIIDSMYTAPKPEPATNDMTPAEKSAMIEAARHIVARGS